MVVIFNQFLGDGFMALFGAPIAHEDHARRGVLAALALQHTLKEADIGKPYGVECAFRIGLNSGLVVVGSIGDNLRMDYSAVGDTTNLAARLQDHTAPGDIVISESTSRLAQGAVRLEALPPVEVKGKTEPVPLYKVLGTLPRRSPIANRSERALRPFVGRERELATLEALFAQAESGHGQVVGIVTEAGGGKSRLLYEFRQRLQDKWVTYLEGRCLSYGSSIPYHPIIDVLRHNCGILETDSPDAIIEKVHVALQEVGMDPETSAPYLLQLLGVKEGTESIAVLTPEAIRTRTFETLKQISLTGSQQRPLIFEIEDVHWVDQTSEAYLASLVESLAGTSILLLTTYRPGYRPSWLDKSYVPQLSLHNLAPHEALTVVHSTSQQTTLPAHLEQQIIAKAEGNPFFLEELTRAVIEHGELHTDIAVPDTIQGVLMARIDHLPEAHKRLLQNASVLGREFSPRLLQAMWEGTDTLEPMLAALKRLEFLYERTGAAEPMYVFTHALTQEVVYESLLTTRRQALHAAAGQALEALYMDRLEDAYDRLAYHYARTDDAIKAVEYLSLVAKKAAGGYAHEEAVEILWEALIRAKQLPSPERAYRVIDLVVLQAESFFRLGRRHEAVALLLEWQDLLTHIQHPLRSRGYYAWLDHTYAYLGDRERAVQNGQRALEDARRCGDPAAMGRAYAMLGQEAFFAGDIPRAIPYCQRAAALLPPTPERYWLGLAFQNLGASYCFRGDLPHSVETYERLEALAQAMGDERLRNNAVALMGWSYAMLGEGETGIATCQRALGYAPDAFETAFTLGLLGYAYRENGAVTTAVTMLEQAVEQAQQYRSRQVQSWFKTFLGEAYHMNGQLAKAQNLACQGFALAEEIKNPWGMGIAQRALGRITYTIGHLGEAETQLQDARATFEAIQARFELARTHLDLASLAHAQENQDTATTHLSTAYAWFKKLQVPKWVERTEHLAHEYGVTRVEVVLEELAEDSS